MTAQIDFLGDPIFQAIGVTGPIAGGQVWCYSSGTSSLRNMYGTITDAVNQTNPIANPIVLDANGRASIVYSGGSKFVLENNDINPSTGHGSVIWTADNVGNFNTTVYGANGDIVTAFTSNGSSAINYFNIVNGITGQPPSMVANGGDPNIGETFICKGSGRVTFQNGFGNYSFPAKDGTNGSVLTTNGAGDWEMVPPVGVSGIIPPGAIMAFAMGSAPTGWLNCDGSAISRATYSALFANIGTTWGIGDGVNTFNIPNSSGNIIMGLGNGFSFGAIAAVMGAYGGEQTHALTLAESPSHFHSTTTVTTTATAASGVGVSVDQGVSSTNTGSNGGGGAHNNIQPSMVMLICIKV